MLERPMVRYHGGKWNLAPWIVSHFPKHQVYTELFGGGGSVLMRKPRSCTEVYNDLDSRMVNLFRVMRDFAPELKRLCESTLFSREELRGAFEQHPDPIEDARRVLVRSAMGFGSNAINHKSTGFRNNGGRGCSAHNWANLREQFEVMQKRLSGVIIENADAFGLYPKYDSPQTLHYIDPPYPKSTRGDTKDDYAHELDDSQHDQLWHLASDLQGYVVVSGYNCDLYRERSEQLGYRRVGRASRVDSGAFNFEYLWLCPRVQRDMKITKQAWLFEDFSSYLSQEELD